MNRLFILLAILCCSFASEAQSNKTIRVSLETDTCSGIVHLYRIEQGAYKLADECSLKETKQTTLTDTCNRAFYLIRYNKRYTKFYATTDKEVKLQINNDGAVLVKPSKENKILDKWEKLSHEARFLSVRYNHGDREKVLQITPFYDAMRKLEGETDKFLSQVKSSDEFFSEAIPALVDADINYFKLFHPKNPLIAVLIKELPADLYDPIRKDGRIGNPRILDVFENTIEYVHLYGARCQHQDYLKGKAVVKYVDSPEVQVAYLLKFAWFQKDGSGLKNIETYYADLFAEGYAHEQLVKLKKEFAIRAEKAKLSKIELKTTDDKVVKLSDFRGKVLVVDVWATWCAPCMKKRPAFEKLAHEMKGENVAFVAISLDDSEIKWKQIAEKSDGIELLDYKREFSTAYGVSSIPHFLIFDAEGNLVDSPAPSPGTGGLKKAILKTLKGTSKN